MYLHQAMKEPDKDKFLATMVEEMDAQLKGGNFSLILSSKVPKGATILPAVWQMKHKCRIQTQEVYKWKAHLNIDGSHQVKGWDYWDTYTPVATWGSICLILAKAIIQGWHSKQIDFVMAYTQAPVKWDMYMEISKGFKVEGDGDYILQIHKNIYSQKQAGRIWNKHLVVKLKSIRFHRCQSEECMFMQGKAIYVLYTDDSILTGPDLKELDKIIEDMKQAGLDLMVEGDISDFLGVNIQCHNDGTVHLTQPHLINSILEELGLQANSAKSKTILAASSKLLGCHDDMPLHDKASFHYRRIIGKLNYLEKSTRSDITYTTHQCARFSANPRQPHANAVKWLGRYLKGTRDKGMILKPTRTSFGIYVDADFAGNWKQTEADSWDTTHS